MVTVRLEKPEDTPQVRRVNSEAFGQSTEAGIVDELRRACPEALFLVAEDEGEIVGHIAFTPVVIDNPVAKVEGMGLAPMAVLPSRQRQGIGSRLVKTGLNRLRDSGCAYVIVLGHPEYYPRFGFELASRYNVECQWEGVPDEAFMILVFDHSVLQNLSGVARYRDEFNEAMK